MQTVEIFLENLSKKVEIDSYEYSMENGVDHQNIVGIILKLETIKDVIAKK